MEERDEQIEFYSKEVGLSTRAVGKKFNISAARVCQILTKRRITNEKNVSATQE